MSLELTSLNRSGELDNSSFESTGAKLYREAQLLLGGISQGTVERAASGLSAENWVRTVASFGLAAGLSLAMRRPGLLGNMARGAGTLGGLSFAADLTNTQRLSAIGGAIQDTWQSGDRFNGNYSLVKRQLGQIGFDTALGIGGGALGGGLASRFCRPGLPASGELAPAMGANNEGLSLNSIPEPALARQAEKTRGLAAETAPLRAIKITESPLPAEPGASFAADKPLGAALAELTPPAANAELQLRSLRGQGDGLMKVQPEHQETRALPASDLLRQIKPEDAGSHYVEDYARALEGSRFKATELMHVGGDTISLLLDDGNVLKVTNRTLIPEMGTRAFDVPILEKGSGKAGNVDISYFVQPKGEPVTVAQNNEFMNDLARQGWWFSDPGKRNSIFLPAENRVALVDPWAVEKLPELPAQEQMSARAAAAEETLPLNAFSHSDEAIGRQISNFADTPFTFHGKRYASFESFYQSLKFADLKERSRIAKLPGKQAKEAGSKSQLNETKFDGKTFELGSPAHHSILQEALMEKFLQNPQLARDFAATSPRPIVHDVGRPEAPGTHLPAEKFARMLEDVRSQLNGMDLSLLGKRRK